MSPFFIYLQKKQVNMIDINDLRIGNYIRFKDGTIKKVKGILFERDVERDYSDPRVCLFKDLDTYSPYVFVGDDTMCDVARFSPIPLTEELLGKCGFEKIKESCYRLKFAEGGEVKAPNGGVWCVLRDSYIIYNEGQLYIDSPSGVAKYPGGFNFAEINGVEYLHQLQNLYYFLTDKELDVNL